MKNEALIQAVKLLSDATHPGRKLMHPREHSAEDKKFANIAADGLNDFLAGNWSNGGGSLAEVYEAIDGCRGDAKGLMGILS